MRFRPLLLASNHLMERGDRRPCGALGLAKGVGEGGVKRVIDFGHGRTDPENGERGYPMIRNTAGDDASIMVQVGSDI